MQLVAEHLLPLLEECLCTACVISLHCPVSIRLIVDQIPSMCSAYTEGTLGKFSYLSCCYILFTFKTTILLCLLLRFFCFLFLPLCLAKKHRGIYN